MSGNFERGHREPRKQAPEHATTVGVAANPWPHRLRWMAVMWVVVMMVASPFGLAQHSPFPPLRADRLLLVVQAPRLLTPGVPSDIVVRTFSPDGTPISAALTLTLRARDVKDAQGNAVPPARITGFAENGEHRFALDTVPIPPGGQLDFTVRALSGNDMALVEGVISRRMREALGYVATDKPLYKPGETVYFRALTVDRATLRPIEGGAVKVELKDPRGSNVGQWTLGTERGVVSGSYTFAAGMPGGEYTLIMTDPTPNGAFPPTERKFMVRHYRAPRLKMDLEFNRESYGPGEAGVAFVSVKRAEGGTPDGARATAVVMVDGREVNREEIAIVNGAASVAFALPETIETGNGVLSLAVRDGGVIENLSRTIPIVLGKMDVAFFPEGGDLVVGLPSRVYFRARDMHGTLVDLKGDIRDAQGAVVATTETDVKGLGRFEFTPQPGKNYRLHVTEPVGITSTPALPAAKRAGVVMKSSADAFGQTDKIAVELRASSPGLYTVAAYCRGACLAIGGAVLAGNGTAGTVELAPRADLGGVVRLTVYGPDGLPVAERLVSRDPARQLSIEITPSGDKFSPRDAVAVRVRARNAAGQPVVAVLGVSVVDEAVLSLAKDEKTAPLPMHYLLGMDVDELEKTELFAGDTPKSRAAVDRLLGTQGWRRFVWREPARLKAQSPESAARIIGYEPTATFDEPQIIVNLRGRDAGIFAPAKPAPIPAPPPPVAELAENDLRRFRDGMPMPPAVAAPGGGPEPQAMPMNEAAGNAPNDRDNAELPDFAGGEFMNDALRANADAPMEPAAGDVDERGRFAGRRPWRPEMVREYAHQASTAEVRSDFAETLYWHAALITNAQGEADFKFDMADSVTSYSIRVDGVAADGALGLATQTIVSRIPFFIEPKAPFEVSAGDVVQMPVAVVNDTDAPMDVELMLAVEGPVRVAQNLLQLRLPANARDRAVFVLHVDQGHGTAKLTLTGTSASLADSVSRRIVVEPRGYPVQVNHSGIIERRDIFTLPIPDGIDMKTLEGKIRVFPSTLAQLESGLESLLREPSGCFEQTSSTTYPNIMVMQYLQETNTARPEIARRAKDLIGRGYARLVGYECPKNGYEWFGGDPGHEALTAYGIMEFIDMKQVWDGVDTSMIERTAEWLMNRRDGNGGFLRNPRALDTFGRASDTITNAYIVWALTEAGMAGQLGRELDALERAAADSTDGYHVALASTALLNARRDSGKVLVRKLASMQKPTGEIEGKDRSITGSGGLNLHIEATSLAILAFLKQRETMGNAAAAVRWLSANRQGGAFGATQSTILALKALVVYSREARRADKPFDLAMSFNGQRLEGRHVAVGEQGAVEFASFVAKLTPGVHELQLDIQGMDDALPYSVELRYRSTIPPSDPSCAIGLKAALSAAAVAEGELMQMHVEVENRRDRGVAMTVARLGLPAGLQPRAEQLQELREAGHIAFYETRAREIILYWRDMAPKQKRTLALDLVGDVPGRYEGPASTAYLYYENLEKTWVPALTATVTAE